MKRHLIFLTSMLLPSLPLAAQEAGGAEAQLREALRNATLQIRTLQNEKAEAEAARTVAETRITELEAALESATKQAAGEQAQSRAERDELNARNEEARAEIKHLDEALAKWKEGYHKAADVARATETQRARLADENSVLKARVRDYRAQNIELHTLAMEVLQRYEDFGTGRALAAKEPFTRITRARVESLVQEYRDEAEKNRIRPEQPGR